MAPTDLLRAWFEAHGRNDLEGARQLVVDDLSADMSGTRLRGFDAFMAWYEQRRTAEGPSFSYRVDDVLGGENHAAAVLTLSTVDRSWRQVVLYTVRGGLIAEIWAREDGAGLS